MPPENNSQPTPENEPAKSPEEIELEASLKQIRTFQGDIADALKQQQESVVSIQRAEHAKHPGRSTEEIAVSKKRTQFFFLFMGSLMLFVLGGLGAWFGYQEFVKRTIAPIVEGPANRFFSPNKSYELEFENLGRDVLLGTINSTKKEIPDGEVAHLVLSKASSTESTLITTSEFLTTLGTSAPGALVRAFDPLFMLGAVGNVSTTTTPNTFLVIKLTSFENAFAGMLQWENVIASDLSQLLSTRGLVQTMPIDTTFVDITDKNKDIRVLYAGEIPVLLYSFFDNNMLIITDSLDTMRTVVERLAREKLSR